MGMPIKLGQTKLGENAQGSDNQTKPCQGTSLSWWFCLPFKILLV